MAGRPEGSDGGNWGYDPDAWKEFTPWRPGDPPNSEPTPDHGSAESQTSGHRGWTEEVPRRYGAGDKVRSQRAVGAGIFPSVQPGTRGEVVSVRHGLLGGDFVTVRFESGYTEEVKADDLEKRGWLD